MARNPSKLGIRPPREWADEAEAEGKEDMGQRDVVGGSNSELVKRVKRMARLGVPRAPSLAGKCLDNLVKSGRMKFF